MQENRPFPAQTLSSLKCICCQGNYGGIAFSLPFQTFVVLPSIHPLWAFAYPQKSNQIQFFHTIPNASIHYRPTQVLNQNLEKLIKQLLIKLIILNYLFLDWRLFGHFAV